MIVILAGRQHLDPLAAPFHGLPPRLNRKTDSPAKGRSCISHSTAYDKAIPWSMKNEECALEDAADCGYHSVIIFGGLPL
jgi:hypothetical protein